jgi:hypothetical protein
MEPDDFEFVDPDFDFEDVDVFLDFIDPDQDIPPALIQRRVEESLEEYTLGEILDENEKTEADALEFMYELGFIGLPEVLEYEEVEDREETEEG